MWFLWGLNAERFACKAGVITTMDLSHPPTQTSFESDHCDTQPTASSLWHLYLFLVVVVVHRRSRGLTTVVHPRNVV